MYPKFREKHLIKSIIEEHDLSTMADDKDENIKDDALVNYLVGLPKVYSNDILELAKEYDISMFESFRRSKAKENALIKKKEERERKKKEKNEKDKIKQPMSSKREEKARILDSIRSAQTIFNHNQSVEREKILSGITLKESLASRRLTAQKRELEPEITNFNSNSNLVQGKGKRNIAKPYDFPIRTKSQVDKVDNITKEQESENEIDFDEEWLN